MAKKPVGMPVGNPVTSAEEGVSSFTEGDQLQSNVVLDAAVSNILNDKNLGDFESSSEARYTLDFSTVSIPIVKGVFGYVTRRFEVNLKSSEAVTLRSVLAGLIHQEATLANGKIVKRPTDAIRWLIQQAGSTSNDNTNAG